MPFILFHCILVFLFPSPMLFPQRHHCEQARVSIDDLFRSHIGSAFPSNALSISIFHTEISSFLPLFLLKAARFAHSPPGCKAVRGAALLCCSKAFPEFSGCF